MTTLRDPLETHKREGKFDYISWSQAADRLDDVLPDGWSFSIMGIGPDWVHGRLTIGERHFENIGYAENAGADWKKEALKDAASDAFKRCAALAGVARYLYDKDDQTFTPQPRQNGHSGQVRSAGESRFKLGPTAPPPRSSTDVPTDVDPYADLPFEGDPAPTPIRRTNGGDWSFGKLAKEAEARGIPKTAIYSTADKMFGPKTKVTDLEPGQREQIAFEMGFMS